MTNWLMMLLRKTTDLTARYEKYAKAQAWLTDSALYIPTTTYNGAAAVVSRIKPFSGAYAQAGDKRFYILLQVS